MLNVLLLPMISSHTDFEVSKHLFCALCRIDDTRAYIARYYVPNTFSLALLSLRVWDELLGILFVVSGTLGEGLFPEGYDSRLATKASRTMVFPPTGSAGHGYFFLLTLSR